MKWDRSETIGMAKVYCPVCEGEGQRRDRIHPSPCSCVLRSIFRACYARFRHCATKEKYLSKVSLVRGSSAKHRLTYSRLDEEYIVDFLNISRRSLSPFHYEVFKNHYLLGADWRLCCRQMNLDRSLFFHTVYRIQKRLGRVFRDLEPYGLYPVADYFAGTLPGKTLIFMPEPATRKVVRPPLRKSA
jgi:hypothetical protein